MYIGTDCQAKSAFISQIINIDVISSKLYCLQNFVWTNQTIINFILAFLHILINIDSSVKILQKILQPVVDCPDS